MSITEASRFQLRTAIGQILSEEAADILMELLPPDRNEHCDARCVSCTVETYLAAA